MDCGSENGGIEGGDLDVVDLEPVEDLPRALGIAGRERPR